MDASKIKFESVDQYIATCRIDVQALLQKFRATVKKAAPQAEETISYNMPALRLNGIVIYYAAWKEHIGLYPASAGIKIFKTELLKYKQSKGTIQFPLDKPLPTALISKIVKFRVKENQEKVLLKVKKKTK